MKIKVKSFDGGTTFHVQDASDYFRFDTTSVEHLNLSEVDAYGWRTGEMERSELVRLDRAQMTADQAAYELANAPHRGEAARVDTMMRAAD